MSEEGKEEVEEGKVDDSKVISITVGEIRSRLMEATTAGMRDAAANFIGEELRRATPKAAPAETVEAIKAYAADISKAAEAFDTATTAEQLAEATSTLLAVVTSIPSRLEGLPVAGMSSVEQYVDNTPEGPAPVVVMAAPDITQAALYSRARMDAALCMITSAWVALRTANADTFNKYSKACNTLVEGQELAARMQELGRDVSTSRMTVLTVDGKPHLCVL